MNRALWIVQVLLALCFGAAGAMKSFSSLDTLAASLPWVAEVPGWVPRVAGVAELLAAVGLVLPGWTGILPRLTPLAALGLVVVMGLAAALHVVLGELPSVPVNLVLGGMAAFVAWGRTLRLPHSERGK